MNQKGLTPFAFAAGLFFFEPHIDVLSVVKSDLYRAIFLAAWFALAYTTKFINGIPDERDEQEGGGSEKISPRHAKPHRLPFRRWKIPVRVPFALLLLIAACVEMRDDRFFDTGYVVKSSLLYRILVPALVFELFAFIALRATLAWSVRWTPRTPKLVKLSRREYRTVITELAILDLLLVDYPHGRSRILFLLVLYVASALTFGNYLSVHRAIRRLSKEDPDLTIQSRVQKVVKERVTKLGTSFSTLLNSAIRISSRCLRVFLLATTLLTMIVIGTAAVSHPNPVAEVAAVTVHLPPIVSPPVQYTLGAHGYAAYCGELPSQQPGYGLSRSLVKLARALYALYMGGNEGVGATLAGCWSKPEVIREPDGVTIVYDIGALDGRAVSLSIASSTGEREIYLQDGGRLALVQRLLTWGDLITGTPRFTLFNGDAQLTYTTFGTVASVREVVHPTGYPHVSMPATILNESQTTAWVKAMTESSEMLWPTRLTGQQNCPGAISLAPTYGSPVALICEAGKSSRVGEKNTTKITFLGEYAKDGSSTIRSRGQRFSIGQIKSLANGDRS